MSLILLPRLKHESLEQLLADAEEQRRYEMNTVLRQAVAEQEFAPQRDRGSINAITGYTEPTDG